MKLLRVSILLLLTCVAFTAVAKPPPGYRVGAQVLVDASAAMKLSMGGDSAAKKALETSLKAVESRGRLSQGVEISWRSFGGAGADEAGCEVTQLLSVGGVTPGPPVRAAMKEITPRGPRPLATGLEAAIADLPRDENRQRSIVLVTSGVDSCGRDVCLAANDLRQSLGLGTVRVILVGNDATAAKKLACLGKVTTATDAASLEKQMTDAIDAILDPPRITVTATDGAKEVEGRVEFYAASDKVPMLSAATGTPLQVIGGIYQVRVLRGSGEDEDAPRINDGKSEGLRQNVELMSGAQLTLKVPLGGQKAKLTVNVLFNGQAAPIGTRVTVFHAGDTDTPVAGGAPSEPILVPPGRYDVRAEIPGGGLGTIDVWKPEVTIAPGANQTVTLAAAQKLGRVKVSVVSSGIPVTDAAVALIHPNSRGEGEPLFNAGTEIQMAQGTYKAVAILNTPTGEMRASKNGIVVTSGALSEVTVDLGPSALVQVNIAGKQTNDTVDVIVFRSGQMEPAGHLSAFTPQRLPPGQYDLKVHDLSFNPPRIFWFKRITLNAGENRTLNLTAK